MNISKMSKSNNLINIEEKLSMFIIPSLICVNAIDFKDDNNKALELISSMFQCSLLVVRSSATDEDNKSNSLAGEYDSVLNIPLNNSEKNNRSN